MEDREGGEEMFYWPVFFYPSENVKETHHLNVYVFSCYFQLKLFTEFTESLRETQRKKIAAFKN